jgi:hypothetical protein
MEAKVTKMQIAALFTVSGFFAIAALVLSLVALSDRNAVSVGPIVGPFIVAAIIGGMAAGAVASLHRRVSALERRSASNDREAIKQ